MLSKRDYRVVTASFLIVFAVLVYVFFTPNKYEGSGPKEFVIEYGETYHSVVDRLIKAKIIKHKLPMKILGAVSGASVNVKAGRYLIPNNLSYAALLDYFIEGKGDIALLVQIHEGMTINAIAERLDASKITSKAAFLDYMQLDTIPKYYHVKANSMMGYMLPGQYVFFQHSKPEEVVDKFHAAFENFWSDSLKKQLSKSGYSLHQVLTIASIVDGETHHQDEKARIAGVYINRLRIGMKLQADPTVQFARNMPWGRLSTEDLQINSPYNTYRYSGLPPGPINNPGKNAILAVLYPEHHNYLFFVADGTGYHHFSKSFNEHKQFAKNYHQLLNENNE
jgi:UPF0755 protein